MPGSKDDLSEASVVAARPGNASCELSGEAVVLNLDSGLYHGLNPVGSRVWELVQEPRRLDELRDLLQAEYEVEAERLDADLRSVLAEMRAAGLIEVRPD